jgi:peptidoglycan/xylan/chitin deacetylase (PgdA/CDA1 family)
MLSPIQVKRVIKSGAGLAAVAAAPLVRQTAGAGCIFAYHRVTNLNFVDPRVDDWNVAPAMLDRQIAAIKQCADIVPLNDLMSRCQANPASRRPTVALTFDDGYANFFTQVLPILKRHGVPATVFVVTSLIGSTEPPPFDAWSVKNRATTDADAWRLLTWDELDRCLDSGLVKVGGHSHRHRKAISCTPAQLVEEAQTSRTILGARLGDTPAYSYPYGASRLGFVPPAYVNAIEAAGYRLGVTTDLGRVVANTDPYRLPRVEAHGLDGPAVIRAKVLGSLAPYRLTDRLRRAERAA